jgi:hypothetical protein
MRVNASTARCRPSLGIDILVAEGGYCFGKRQPQASILAAACPSGPCMGCSFP